MATRNPKWQYVVKTIRDAASTLSLDRVTLSRELGNTERYADPLQIRAF